MGHFFSGRNLSYKKTSKFNSFCINLFSETLASFFVWTTFSRYFCLSRYLRVIKNMVVAHISRLGWEIWATREGDMGHLSLMIENAFFIQLLIMQYIVAIQSMK